MRRCSCSADTNITLGPHSPFRSAISLWDPYRHGLLKCGLQNFLGGAEGQIVHYQCFTGCPGCYREVKRRDSDETDAKTLFFLNTYKKVDIKIS